MKPTFYSLAGATLGASASFLAARYLAADWMGRRAGGRLNQVVTGVEAEGWRFVALRMRVATAQVPTFPTGTGDS